MRLSIRMDDGTLIEDFDIAGEWGDVRRMLPKAMMANAILNAIEHNQKALDEFDAKVKEQEKRDSNED